MAFVSNGARHWRAFVDKQILSIAVAAILFWFGSISWWLSLWQHQREKKDYYDYHDKVDVGKKASMIDLDGFV